MKCHHFCNEPLRCQTCIRRFWAWVESRTNSPPPKKYQGGPSFYAHVNVVSPPITIVEPEPVRDGSLADWMDLSWSY